MPEEKTNIYEKMAWVFVLIVVALVLAGLVLVGWGFVELVTWITSK